MQQNEQDKICRRITNSTRIAKVSGKSTMIIGLVSEKKASHALLPFQPPYRSVMHLQPIRCMKTRDKENMETYAVPTLASRSSMSASSARALCLINGRCTSVLGFKASLAFVPSTSRRTKQSGIRTPISCGSELRCRTFQRYCHKVRGMGSVSHHPLPMAAVHYTNARQ